MPRSASAQRRLSSAAPERVRSAPYPFEEPIGLRHGVSCYVLQRRKIIALNLKQELEALVDALGAQSVEFAICGGIAVTIHGAPRRTSTYWFPTRNSSLP